MAQIDLHGGTFTYRLRASRRAKRTFISCSASKGLEVVYPHGQAAPDAEALLRERSAWVLTALGKLRESQRQLPAREYRDGECFLLLGAPHRLRLMHSDSAQRVRVNRGDGTLSVVLPASVAEDDRELIHSVIVAAYRGWAKAYLPRRAAALAELHGFQFKAVRIKNQKTRWGSCSAKGNINLNLRLMMAPPEAIDYVILHELCHTRELNHGERFWSLVEMHCPDYRCWRRWFKQVGPKLIL